VRRTLPLAFAGLLVLGCGSAAHHPRTVAELSTRAPSREFPQLHGRALPALIKGLPQGPSLGPTTSIFLPGTDRVGFVLVDRARSFINGATVALYTSDAKGGDAAGPFPARTESLAVADRFRSLTDKNDPAAPKAIYVAHIPLAAGRRALLAIARLDGRMIATAPIPVQVGADASGPPQVGAKAIKVDTPTVASAGSAALVDTRKPPAADLEQVDLASVLGKKPVALLFATPAFCQSRTCGPVEDIVEQAKHDAANARFAFIHVEVYNANNPAKGFRPQLAAWHLPSEPWLFVIDRHGKIRARFEGAFGASEVQAALDGVR
jgi:hypothetical protein